GGVPRFICVSSLVRRCPCTRHLGLAVPAHAAAQPKGQSRPSTAGVGGIVGGKVSIGAWGGIDGSESERPLRVGFATWPEEGFCSFGPAGRARPQLLTGSQL